MTQTYPLDLDPEQVVIWLLAEDRAATHDLVVSAWRSYRPGRISGGKSRLLGQADRDEVNRIVETGLLEVSPRREPRRWTLRVRVEDDIGPRLPEDAPVPEADEALDLQAFYDEFLAGGRGVAEVSLEAGTQADRKSADRLLWQILQDMHTECTTNRRKS